MKVSVFLVGGQRKPTPELDKGGCNTVTEAGRKGTAIIGGDKRSTASGSPGQKIFEVNSTKDANDILSDFFILAYVIVAKQALSLCTDLIASIRSGINCVNKSKDEFIVAVQTLLCERIGGIDVICSIASVMCLAGCIDGVAGSASCRVEITRAAILSVLERVECVGTISADDLLELGVDSREVTLLLTDGRS